MVLDTQLLPIPIAGGLAEGTDPVNQAPGQWSVLDNVLYEKSGSIRKRPGFGIRGSLLAPVARIPLVPTAQGRCVITEQGELHAWRESGEDFARAGVLSPGQIGRRAVVRSAHDVTAGHSVEWGSYRAISYALREEENEELLGVFLRIEDIETGAPVRADFKVEHPDDFPPGEAHVLHVTSDGRLQLVMTSVDPDPLLGSTSFLAFTWDTPSSEAVVGLTLTGSGGSIDDWDAVAGLDGTFFLAWAQYGDVTVSSVAPSGTVLLSVDLETYYVSTRVALSYRSAPGGHLGVMVGAHDDLSGVSNFVSLYAMTGHDLAIAGGRWEVHPQDEPLYAIQGLGLVEDDSGAFTCVWSGPDSSTAHGATWSRNVAFDGAMTPRKHLWHQRLASRPWRMSDSHVYVAVAGGTGSSAVERNLFGGAIVRLTEDDDASTLQIVASVARIEARPIAVTPLPGVVSSNVKNRRVEFPLRIAATSSRRGLDAVSFDAALRGGLWDSAIHLAELHISGGLPSTYDGNQVTEMGFVQQPIITSATVTPGEGLPGPAAPGGTASYAYQAVWRWVDQKGLTHVSEPSPPWTVTLSEKSTVRVTATTPGGTRRGLPGAGEAKEVWLHFYRTNRDAPEVLYELQSRFLCHPDEPIGVIDDSEEAPTGPVLYTSGGLLAAMPPPAFCALVAGKNRLFGINAEDPREVWFSSWSTGEEAPRWSKALTLRIDDAPQGATALAVMDDKLLVFTPTRTYVVAGDGPLDNGAGSFIGPQLVSETIGCIDSRSVVVTPMGTIVRSEAGFYLIPPTLSPAFIGAGVQDTALAYETPLASFYDGVTRRAFWLCASRGGVKVLVLDLGVGQGAWCTWSLPQEDDRWPRALGLWDGKIAYSVALPIKYIEVEPPGEDTPGVYEPLPQEHAIAVQGHGALPHRDIDGTAPTSTLQTTWIRPDAVVERHQRVRHVLLTGRCLGTHTLTVSLSGDYADTPTQMTPTVVNAGYSAGSPIVGLPVQRLDIHVAQQKVAAIRVKLEDKHDKEQGPDEPPTTGAGFLLEGLTLEAGIKQGRAKFPVGNRR